MASVLVVDDEPDVVLFVRLSLEAHGHVVRSASDGAAALAAVRKDPPDVVVLDVLMPKADGWAVLERLKADPDDRIRSVPVVVLTALAAEQDLLRAGIEGSLQCLTKPVTPDALIAAVQAVLGGGPEPAQRHAAQRRALARLAQLERGSAESPAPALVRLSRLERSRSRQTVDPTIPIGGPAGGELTDQQRALLQAVRAAPTVTEAATRLGMSRSNLYASLRRIGRTLDVADVTALLRLLRAGRLPVTLDA